MIGQLNCAVQGLMPEMSFDMIKMSIKNRKCWCIYCLADGQYRTMLPNCVGCTQDKVDSKVIFGCRNIELTGGP